MKEEQEILDYLNGPNEFCYKLDENKNAIPCSVREWSTQIEEMARTHKKHVADEDLNGKRISTVWLGVDHGIDESRPLLFETMVFEGDSMMDIYCDRYSTWEEAEAGHKKAVQWVKDGCKDEV